MSIIIEVIATLWCDHCDRREHFAGSSQTHALKKARAAGWSIKAHKIRPALGYQCRCPDHRYKHHPRSFSRIQRELMEA